MKVISVKQSFATLLALGLKGFETHSWATKHRGETAIHASKQIDKESCRREPIKSVLAAHGFDETNLLTGCILSIGNLVGCYEIGKCDDFQKEADLPWGDRMADMRQIEPILVKGQLGLWNYQEGETE